jgi:hypothetical protein
MFVLGGVGVTLEELWTLDLNKLTWTSTRIAGYSKNRAYHSTLLYGTNLLTFGGQTDTGETNEMLSLGLGK